MYKVAVDGTHLLEYEHRVGGMEDVTLVQVNGDVALYSAAPSMIWALGCGTCSGDPGPSLSSSGSLDGVFEARKQKQNNKKKKKKVIYHRADGRWIQVCTQSSWTFSTGFILARQSQSSLFYEVIKRPPLGNANLYIVKEKIGQAEHIWVTWSWVPSALCFIIWSFLITVLTNLCSFSLSLPLSLLLTEKADGDVSNSIYSDFKLRVSLRWSL